MTAIHRYAEEKMKLKKKKKEEAIRTEVSRIAARSRCI